MKRTDYDRLASEYDRRYATGHLADRGQALLALAKELKAGSILEAGCGTGHWLSALLSALQPASQVSGLDFSSGMLRQAQKRGVPLRLVRGTAVRLPYRTGSFDLVYCVDAVHHFGEPQQFLAEAFRVLSPGGCAAVVGSDPHSAQENWYVYDYFEGVRAADLERFPARSELVEWMRRAGFENVETREVERVADVKSGREVLKDIFLQKNATSQLAMLSEEAYRAGVEKIRQALAQAESRGETLLFRSELTIQMSTGRKP